MHIPVLISDLLNPAQAAWQAFAATAGSALATSLWQGALIVGGLEIVQRLMPRISAAHRFLIWATAFALSAALPFVPLLNSGGPAAQSGSAPSTAWFELDARWGMAIACLWLVTSLVRLAHLAAHSVRLARLWKAARPVVTSPALRSALEDIRGGRVRVWTSEMLDRPSVIGFLAPRILIPSWLLARLTDAELEQIVHHEAEHLRRRDDWSNLLQKLLMAVFPLNPALAWIEHRLCQEREMACDEAVVRITHAPRAYAACLASLAEHGLERRAEALSLGAWHRRSELVGRVHQILAARSGVSRTQTVALLGTVGSMLLVGSLEMARCPELVRFVPRTDHLAMTPARQQELAALLARENSEARLAVSPNFRALPAKAALPPARPSCAARQRGTVAGRNNPAPRPIPARMESPAGDRAATEQRWVVLTTWEEVQSDQTVPRSGYPIADYEPDSTGIDSGSAAATPTEAGSRTAPQAGATRPGDPARFRKFTVTELILRIAPANSTSKSSQPVTGTIQTGWFVIQL